MSPGTSRGLSLKSLSCTQFSAGIYLLTVNNRKTRTKCEICSRLTIKTPERRHWHSSGVFIVNFEHISHLALVGFFNCYLAAPQTTLGHNRGGSLTHPTLITEFYIFDPKVTGSLVTTLDT